MSLSQKIRDALRAAGGPVTSAELRDLLDSSVKSDAFWGTMSTLEASGQIVVDRTSRPFTYTLGEQRVAEAKNAPGTQRAPAKQPKPARRAEPEVGGSAPAAEVPPPTLPAPGADTVAVPRAQVLRLCALALRTSMPLAEHEMREIADLITSTACN